MTKKTLKTLIKNARVELALGGRFLESEGAANDATREVPVLIIKEGMGNRADKHFYSAELFARTIEKFNGIKAYANHPSKTEETDRPERDVREIVGYYHSPRIITIEGKKAIAATLKIIEGESYAWAWNLVKEAAAFAGKFSGKELVGISINAWGKSHEEETASGIINFVDDFSEVQSADIVTQAGAGGGFRLKEAGLRLRETIKKALEASHHKENDMNPNLKAFGEGLKALHDQIKGNPEHAAAYGPACEALMSQHAEMMKGEAPADPAAPKKDDPKPADAPAADSPEAKKEAARLADLAKDFSKMEEAYKSGKMSPVEKALFETILTERAETKIKNDKAFVEKSIKESGIPAAYASDLPLLCAGKSEAEVKTLVEARKALVSMTGNRAEGAGESGAKGGKGGASKMAERLAASGVKMKEVKA